MIKFDYHSHTSNSFDCSVPIDQMVQSAIDIGLSELAITDHVDFTYPDRKIISPKGVAANVEAVQAAARRFEGKIKLLTGIELGLRPDCSHICAEIANSHDFDIVVGAAHEYGSGIDFCHPELYNNHPKHKAYTIYFESVLAVVRACNGFDVLGHFDYVERYAPYPDKALNYADHKEIVDEILRTIVDKGIGIEINTSGLAYGLKRTHPQAEIVSRYARMGGEIITVGSDAHSPSRVAYGFDTACEMLKALGIKFITQFEKRVPGFVKM